ncbi:hypothetical protein P3T18_005390 [Paraburkholderia sp. GAS199]|uniref:hypothetical protein n=1 Tax=Paraburkholderia sp. GAS199 TaxID=3035126 RepID=UPI003D1D1FAD
MRVEDAKEFTASLNLCCSTLRQPLPAKDELKFWFKLLGAYSIEDVKAALIQHMSESRYAPVPADVIGRVDQRIDAWLGSHEAWAVAKLAHDQRNTVVTCKEIQEALDVVRHLLDEGDRYGASNGFREAYERISSVSRKTLAVPHWYISAGFDKEQREQITQKAVNEGRIALADGRAVFPLLAGPGDDDTIDEETAAKGREKIAGLLAMLGKPKADTPRDKAPEISEAERLKAEQQRRVDALLADQARRRELDEREAAIAAREASLAGGVV